jgi:hypothetical protein
MSDTSTKRAEEIAYNLQLSGVSGSTWRATEVDASNMLRALAAENEKLRAALGLAIDAVEHWASYASPYFQEKHDLAGDLQKLRAALGEKG